MLILVITPFRNDYITFLVFSGQWKKMQFCSTLLFLLLMTLVLLNCFNLYAWSWGSFCVSNCCLNHVVFLVCWNLWRKTIVCAVSLLVCGRSLYPRFWMHFTFFSLKYLWSLNTSTFNDLTVVLPHFDMGLVVAAVIHRLLFSSFCKYAIVLLEKAFKLLYRTVIIIICQLYMEKRALDKWIC